MSNYDNEAEKRKQVSEYKQKYRESLKITDKENSNQKDDIERKKKAAECKRKYRENQKKTIAEK